MVVDGIISVVSCGARGRVGKAEPDRKETREGRRVSMIQVGSMVIKNMCSTICAVQKDKIVVKDGTTS